MSNPEIVADSGMRFKEYRLAANNTHHSSLRLLFRVIRLCITALSIPGGHGLEAAIYFILAKTWIILFLSIPDEPISLCISRTLYIDTHIAVLLTFFVQIVQAA